MKKKSLSLGTCPCSACTGRQWRVPSRGSLGPTIVQSHNNSLPCPRSIHSSWNIYLMVQRARTFLCLCWFASGFCVMPVASAARAIKGGPRLMLLKVPLLCYSRPADDTGIVSNAAQCSGRTNVTRKQRGWQWRTSYKKNMSKACHCYCLAMRDKSNWGRTKSIYLPRSELGYTDACNSLGEKGGRSGELQSSRYIVCSLHSCHLNGIIATVLQRSEKLLRKPNTMYMQNSSKENVLTSICLYGGGERERERLEKINIVP